MTVLKKPKKPKTPKLKMSAVVTRASTTKTLLERLKEREEAKRKK